MSKPILCGLVVFLLGCTGCFLTQPVSVAPEETAPMQTKASTFDELRAAESLVTADQVTPSNAHDIAVKLEREQDREKQKNALNTASR